MLQPLDTTAVDHPALEADLEYASLLREPELAGAHLGGERRRVERTLAAGGWGFSSPHALLLVRPMPWDTAHFGVSCADLLRLYELDETAPIELDALIDAALGEARRRGVGLLSARLGVHQARALHALERRGFLLVDTSIEIGTRLPLTAAPPPVAGLQIRAPRGEDQRELEAIAATFRANRFHRDSRVPAERARGVYTSWVTAAAEGRHGRLLVAELDGRVAGFCAYVPAGDGEPVVTIGLAAIAPPHRGRRLFESLVCACAEEAAARVLVSSTQVSNTATLRAFARLGLLPYNARHVLHGWL
jgi:ribosomal protein S18 acetylase RimI-like enzyme